MFGGLLFIPLTFLEDLFQYFLLLFGHCSQTMDGASLPLMAEFEKRWGKINSLNPAALDQDDRMFHAVFQLPNIPGPGIIEDQSHGLGTEIVNIFILLQTELV